MTTVYSSSIEPFEPRARLLIDSHPQDDGTDDDNLASSILGNAPKSSSRFNSFYYGTPKGEEFWTIRKIENGEEQLYARGKCVYWTRNSLILKSFNFTEQVVKVFWSELNKNDHVCVALMSGLSIFDHIGQHFQIQLPFAYKEMYATKLCLVIERNCDSSDDSSLPVLFSLTQPTHEITPIVFKSINAKYSFQTTKLSYCMPNNLTLVGCHEELPFCLMYNSQECQHSLWKLRPIDDHELEEFNKMRDESINNILLHNQTGHSLREGMSHNNSLNMSGRHRSSLIIQTNHSSTMLNLSSRLEMKSRPSLLGNLAASRLGVGCTLSGGDPNSTNVKSFNSNYTFNTMSTPNRKRIINYLRDTIEEPILPEMTFEQVWTDPSNKSSRATKFFDTTDMVGNNFLVMVVSASNVIKMIKYEISADDELKIQGRANYITAVDASPIKSLNIMIVIDTSKNFALYSGADRVAQLMTPQISPTCLRLIPNFSPSTIRTMTMDMSPIHTSSARKRSSVGERSSIGSDLSFHQMFPTLSPVPHAVKHDSKTSTPVSVTDLKKIEHVIGSTVYVCSNNMNRVRIEIPPICQTQYVWRLLNAMKLLVSRDTGLMILSRWYQARRSSSQPELITASCEMDIFKHWFLNCLGVDCSFVFDDSTTNYITRTFQSSPSKKSRRIREIETNPMVTNVYTLFYAMHLVFEDLLLVKVNYEIVHNLVELLMILACMLKLEKYQNYYWLKFPLLQDKFSPHFNNIVNSIPGGRVESLYKPAFFSQNPPSIMDSLSRLVTLNRSWSSAEEGSVPTYPNITGVTNDSFIVVSLFCEMFNIDAESIIMTITPTMTGFNKNINLQEPPHRSPKADKRVVELLVEFGKDRDYLSHLPEGINLYLWDAILNCRESPPIDWCESCFNLVGRKDLVDLVCGGTDLSINNYNFLDENDDPVLKLLFPDDIRVSEAHRMLSSDVPVEFSIGQRPGSTEEELRREMLNYLDLLNTRTMGMPVGRGAINLRTYFPVIGESFEVPRLDLTGRVLPEERPIEREHNPDNGHIYPWPYFHNGVAAGLTICASTTNNIIDSTWINYNRPRSNIPQGADSRDRDLIANINNEHAGFLFALGLNGHLEKLSLMALHDYLCQNNDLTKLAILLGMSAAKRGSRDTNIIKVLSIHVDALLPPNSTELDVSAPVHAASIIGVGLLYQGSADSHISKVLLEEIGRLPGPEANSHLDRESYSLSAGLAFGLVNLCKGESATISSSDQLRLYMLGGKRKPLTASQRSRYFKQDCHRGEEDYINTHITSPGGTLGLGLMYHRTQNESVANWMRAPDTQTLLESVRPDFLILRMLSYGLIMWDKVEPTEEYINSHTPEIVSRYAFPEKELNSPGSRIMTAKKYNPSVDYELISQSYCNIVAGCCMAIAIRYAGTADRKVYNVIYKNTKYLIAISKKLEWVELAGRPCLEACLNVLVTSLAVVMAGTGDLGVMRVCRYMRSRLTHSCVFYGSYMAVHMALGLLFLGSCRCSLSTSPESIGALVCALYPIYPNHTSENRYHLQALRHLYVLAAEPRLLIPRDILSKSPVYVNITVRQRTDTKSIKELVMKAPCLMPEIDSVLNVIIDDGRYWRIEIKDKQTLLMCLIQGGGYLSVEQKAHSTNNQLVQNIETHILQNMSSGIIKSQKASVLSECVKEDRVEQYAALNKLLTHASTVDKKIFSLFLEQMRFAYSLSGSSLTNKINLLQPVIGDLEDNYNKEKIEKAWIDYVGRKTDWTNTNPIVAHYVALNDLKYAFTLEDDILQSLNDINFQ